MDFPTRLKSILASPAPSLFLVLLLATGPARICVAQTETATLSGTITDQSGALVVGAAVRVTNQDTNVSIHTKTNEAGVYSVPALKPGRYKVEVEKEGFKRVSLRDVTLNVQDTVNRNFALQVGALSETIQVQAEATRVSTSPSVSTVIDRQFVENLPLNGRSFQSLILLTPGVVQAVEGVAQGNGQFSVNGQRQNANYFTVDGVSANIAVFCCGAGSQEQAGTLPGLTALGTTQNLVSIDALEEYRIQTSTYSAEFGRQPGGQIALVTRSGTNQLHGTLFEYLRNEATDANDWFLNRAGLEQPPLRQNQFGGTFGGPVVLPKLYDGRNRTFFFFSYEGLRLRLPNAENTFVPSLRLRQMAPPAVQPLLNIFSLPTGPETMVDDDFDPTTPDVLSGVAPFVGGYSSPSSMDATSIRLDHKLSSKLTLFGRYTETPSSFVVRGLSFLIGDKSHTRTVTLGTTLSLSPRLNNEFRFNYSRNRGRQTVGMDDFGGAVPVDPSVFVSGYSGPGPKFGSVFFFLPGDFQLGPVLGDQFDSYQRQFSVVDNMSLVRGAHHWKFGFDYRRLAPIFGPVAYGQQTFFLSEADILSGSAFLRIFANQGSRPLFHNLSAYAQDSWRVTPRLTLDLGLRWELNPSPNDQNGLEPVLVSLTSVDDLPTANLAPPDTPIYNTFYGAFAPRAGVSYQLQDTPGKETVLRGGFGVYHDLGSGPATAVFTGGFPFFAATGFVPVTWPIPPALAVPPAFPALTLPITRTLPALDPDLKLPYTLQWNVALQQALGPNQAVTVSYVASAGRRLLTTQLLNEPVAGVRPNPNFRTIRFTSNSATSGYHSLQVQFQRQLSRGLQALVNYTWSHDIDEVSNEVQADVLDRGNADFDVRHNFSAGVTYDVPKLSAGPVLTALLRDWSVNSTLYAQAGPPVNLSAGFLIRDDGTRIAVRPDVVPGVLFWITDPSVPGGRRINPAAFQAPPLDPVSGSFARQGTLGRNVVRLPGSYEINMALQRQFNFSERWKLQFKAEAFNLLNHPLFGRYNTNITSSTFGVARDMQNHSKGGGLNVLYQTGGPRSMQFSLRLSF
jgi:hypothetical protein